MLKRILFTTLVLCAVCPAELLRVMSYNVRYPSKSDGPDLWDTRRDLFVASVRVVDPDIIGT